MSFRRTPSLILACGLLWGLSSAKADVFNIPPGDTDWFISRINVANGLPGPHTINLAENSTYTFTKVDNNTHGFNALPVIEEDITIVGNGSTIAIGAETGWACAAGGDGDECSIPQVLNGDILSSALLNNNTGITGNDTSCGLGDTIDEWLCWTPECDGVAMASTCHPATEVDTTIAVFDWCGGNQLVCNDDFSSADCDLGGSNVLSRVYWPVTAGQSYLVRVSIVSDNVVGDGEYGIELTCSTNGMRAFLVQTTGTLTLENLTIQDGRAERGGCIRNRGGHLELHGCTIRGGDSDISGGAITNALFGTLLMTDSTLEDNQSSSGGALKNISGTAELIGCTLNGNTADNGGAVNNDFNSEVTMTNCTMSDNSAPNGGAISNFSGTLACINCTVTDNNSFGGGAVRNTLGTLELTNTIVANQNAGADCSGNVAITSFGHNLDSDGTCIQNGVNNDMTRLSADLGPLQDNGGPTMTHALLAGSPAVDRGDNAMAPAEDQRGITREEGLADDIGAFEFQPDCNGNGIPDTTDLAEATSADCNGNGIPDECDPALQIGSCPADIEVTATSELGAEVTYNLPAVSGGCNPAVESDVPSGSVLPVGTTLVTVTAADDAGAEVTCTFNVTVLPEGGGPAGPPAGDAPDDLSAQGCCGAGADGAVMMPMSMLGFGWIRKRRTRTRSASRRAA